MMPRILKCITFQSHLSNILICLNKIVPTESFKINNQGNKVVPIQELTDRINNKPRKFESEFINELHKDIHKHSDYLQVNHTQNDNSAINNDDNHEAENEEEKVPVQRIYNSRDGTRNNTTINLERNLSMNRLIEDSYDHQINSPYVDQAADQMAIQNNRAYRFLDSSINILEPGMTIDNQESISEYRDQNPSLMSQDPRSIVVNQDG